MVQAVETPARTRNKRATITDDNEHGVVTYDFGDGGPNLVCRLSELSPAIVTRLAVKALHNKGMDSYADPATEPRHEATGVWTELKNGVWSTRGEAGPKRPTLLIEALSEMYKKSVAGVEKWLEAQSEGDIASLKKRPDVKAKVQELQARRATEKARALKTAAKGLALAAIDIADIPE